MHLWPLENVFRACQNNLPSLLETSTKKIQNFKLNSNDAQIIDEVLAFDPGYPIIFAVWNVP